MTIGTDMSVDQLHELADRQRAEITAKDDRIEALEAELAKTRCPIGLDDKPDICSMSTCHYCLLKRARFLTDENVIIIDRAAAAEADRDRLREALEGINTDRGIAEGIKAPEDPEVLSLCERVGYGAVMDSAARQWLIRDLNGALTVGPCATTVRKALSGSTPSTGADNWKRCPSTHCERRQECASPNDCIIKSPPSTEADWKPHQYVPDLMAGGSDCRVCGHPQDRCERMNASTGAELIAAARAWKDEFLRSVRVRQAVATPMSNAEDNLLAAARAHRPSTEKVCDACRDGSPRTRDGRHHPGYNGHRFYKCRTATTTEKDET